MKRGLIFAVFCFIMATQYINCSGYSDGLNANEQAVTLTTDDTAYESVKVLNGDTYMNCYNDNVQVGGSCNTADTVDNYIQYWLTNDAGTRVSWTTSSGLTDHLTAAKCENGRFAIVIPKPTDVTLADGTTGYSEYQLHMQMYTTVDNMQYTVGELGSIFVFNIEKNADCN